MTDYYKQILDYNVHMQHIFYGQINLILNYRYSNMQRNFQRKGKNHLHPPKENICNTIYQSLKEAVIVGPNYIYFYLFICL